MPWIKRNDLSFMQYKIAKTIAIMGVMLVMGISHSMTPATLPDLRAKVGITVEEAGRAFAFSGIGVIVGSLLAVVTDRYHQLSNLIAAILIFISGTANALKPLSPNLPILCALSLVEGTGWSSVNAGMSSEVLNIWGESSGPPMLAVCFGYPLGHIIGPLIAYPFVSRQTENTTTMSFAYNSTTIVEIDSQITIAYGITAALASCMSVVFICFQLLPKHPSANTWRNKVEISSWKNILSPSVWANGNGKYGLTILLLVITYYFLYVGSVTGHYKYYLSYAVESELDFTKQEGLLFSATMNFAGAFARFCGIIASKYIPINRVIATMVTGQVVVSILTIIWGSQHKISFLIFCSLYLFMGSPLWPYGMLWTNKHIHVLAFVVGLTDISACTSDIVFSYLLGYMYEYVGKQSIFYCTSVLANLLGIHFIVMNVVARNFKKKYWQQKVAPCGNEMIKF